MSDECDALIARVNALEKMLDEREERTKERFAAMDKSVTVAMQSAEKAVTKAEHATERRFEGVNEFGRTFRELTGSYLPRSEYSVQHQGLLDRITATEASLREIESVGRGKKEGLSLIGQFILAGITAASAIGAFLIAFLHRI